MKFFNTLQVKIYIERKLVSFVNHTSYFLQPLFMRKLLAAFLIVAIELGSLPVAALAQTMDTATESAEVASPTTTIDPTVTPNPTESDQTPTPTGTVEGITTAPNKPNTEKSDPIQSAIDTVTSGIQSLIPTIIPTTSQPKSSTKAIKRVRLMRKAHLHAREAVEIRVENGTKEDVKITLKDIEGKILKTTIIEEKEGNNATLKLLPPQRLRPGKYSIEVVDSKGETTKQDFTWGVLAINTNKSVYTVGETAELSIGVLDTAGEMVCNAEVTLVIENEVRGTIEELSTKNGKVKINPECLKKELTEVPDYEAEYKVEFAGTYSMTLTAETGNGIFTIDDFFTVNESVQFDVERNSATRIYPVNSYPVSMKITANKDFSGTVTDIVPDNFVITKSNKKDVQSYNSVERMNIPVTTNEMPLPNLRLPFDGKYPVSFNFAEIADSAAVQQTYEAAGVSGHDGVDFDMPIGTPIKAVDAGDVIEIPKGVSSYGKTIAIDHAWGRTFYGHLSEFKVQPGDKVEKGQVIALSGNTGFTTGPHLHFSLRPNNAHKENGFFGKVNPLPYLGLEKLTTAADTKSVQEVRWNVSLKKGESITLGYIYDAPNTSPQFYLLGPLQLTDEKKKTQFEEQRQWQIAVDSAGTDMILFWDPANGAAPSGWSVLTSYDGRFIRGESAANATTTGGTATHTPTISSHTMSTGTSGRLGGSTNSVSSYAHTHTLTNPTIGSASNLPAFRSMQLIAYDNGIPTTIPANAIAMFDASPGMPGSGWTRVTAQDTRLIRANTTVATGGSDTHTHTVTWAALGAASGTIATGANTNNQGATTTHTHTAPAASNSDSQANLPPYVHTVFASANSEIAIPTGMIAMFDGAPSGLYDVISESGDPYYQKFIRGNTAANAGTTGGSSTHSHAATTSGVSGAPSATARGTASAGTVAAGNSHTHTSTANYNANTDNTPEYVNLVIAEKIDAPVLDQIHSRWRNDDGSETTATWRRSEDTAATAAIGVTRRLRIEVSNEGTQSSGSTTYRLEYGLKASTCDAIASWTAVTAAAPGGSDKFQMHDSSNLTDGNATTDVAGGLTNENTTFVAGQVKDTGNQTTGITLTTSQFTEIEYSIKPTSNAVATEIYCFRVTNAGSTTNFNYTVYPELTVGDPVLDQKHYRWRYDNGGESTLTNQTVSLLPTGQGATTGWASTGCVNDTAEWDCVNDNATADSTNDGTGTHLTTTTAGARSSFSLDNGQVPVGSTVSQIDIVMVGAEVAAAGGDASVTAFYTIGAGNVDCASSSGFGSQTYSTQTCSFTGLNLTATNIDNLEIGILFGGNDPTITKIYATITYSRTAATWIQNEDLAPLAVQSKLTNKRLRFSIANTGDIAANRNFRLEYAQRTGATCGDETFTAVPVTATTEHFDMVTSTYFANGEATTTQLTATGLGTFSAGKMIEDPSNSSGTMTMTNAYYTEVEYVFQGTANASGTYCMRVSDNGTELDAYTIYAEVSFPGSITISGNAYGNYEESTSAWSSCDTSITQNISVSVNGGTKVSGYCDDSTGFFSFTVESPTDARQVVAIYMDDGVENTNDGVTYTLNADTVTDITDIKIYQNVVWITSESSTSVTNADLGVYDSTDDPDIPLLYTGAVTTDADTEIHVAALKTYAPGGNVTTGKLHIEGTYSAGNNTLTLTSNGSGICTAYLSMRPLCIEGGTFNADTSTTNFTGATVVNTIQATTYYNLGVGTTSDTSNGAVYTLQGNVTVNGTLTIGNASSTNTDTLNFPAVSYTLSLLGSGTNPVITAKGNLDPVTGTISYKSITGATVPAETYYNLEFSPASGTNTFQFGGAVVVGGNLTIDSGNTAAVTVDTDTAGGTVDINGNLTIGSSGNTNDEFQAPSSASFTVAGNLTEYGTFTHNDGTVTLDGSGTQTLTGGITFYNLTANASATRTLEFAAGSTTTIATNGNLSLTGTSCSTMLNLRSTTDGNPWTITDNSGGTTTLTYLDVKNSTATNTMTATNSIDSSGNTNWTIDGLCGSVSTNDKLMRGGRWFNSSGVLQPFTF